MDSLRAISYLVCLAGAFIFCFGSSAGMIAGDIDLNGTVEATDVQLVINSALGIEVPYYTDIDYSGDISAPDVQLVINAVLTVPMDIDVDGLCDRAEENLGTQPDAADTDGDGMTDGDEVSYDGDPGYNPYHPTLNPDGTDIDPTRSDTDSDGLIDGDELNFFSTNPLLADTDGDGLVDGDEVGYDGDPGYNPYHPTLNPDGTDLDPTRSDTDDDGLADGDEVHSHGTSPVSIDTDLDGVSDWDEVMSGLIGYDMVVNGGFDDASGWIVYDLGSVDPASYKFGFGLDCPAGGTGTCLRIHGSARQTNILFWQPLNLKCGMTYALSGAFKDRTADLYNLWCELYLSMEEPVEGTDWTPPAGTNDDVYLGFNTWAGCAAGIDGTFEDNGCVGRRTRFYTVPGEPGEHVTVYLGLKTGVYANSGSLDYDVLVDDISLIVAGPGEGDATYYVDSTHGNDRNSGTDPQEAWATLKKVNGIVFQPGDRVLFAAGSVYRGRLKPSGSGAEGAPIGIGMYGDGGRPRIDTGGEFNAAVLLSNVEYYEVSDLEITNTGPTRAAGRRGVHLALDDFGVANHIHLDNLYIHDVNGSNVKDEGGGNGIQWTCSGSNARFDDLVIENCYLVRTDRNGITGWSDYCYPWWRWNPSTNVVIRNNLLEDIGGDGIVPIGADGCIVEYNKLDGGRMRAQDWAAGIWPWGCKNTTIQFNEVTGMKGTKDGQAFDCDYECSNTVIQYNYSHDNDGGFLLVCAPGRSDYGCRDSVIRYNISQNDGSDSRIFHISGGSVYNTKIYNNVIFSNLDNQLVKLDNWEGWPDGTQFYNNIFYVTGMARYYWGDATNTVFENNVFYGNHAEIPDDSSAIIDDPMLMDPGSGGNGLESLDGYKPVDGSPCIGAAIPVPDNGGRDFWGNPVDPTGPDNVGAYEAFPPLIVPNRYHLTR